MREIQVLYPNPRDIDMMIKFLWDIENKNKNKIRKKTFILQNENPSKNIYI